LEDLDRVECGAFTELVAADPEGGAAACAVGIDTDPADEDFVVVRRVLGGDALFDAQSGAGGCEGVGEC